MSTLGCWTCRVRRKRCEGHDGGRCHTCFRLGLSCDGYGERPHWMDGGDRERLRRQELKATIKNNAHSQRNRRGRGPDSATEQETSLGPFSPNIGPLPDLSTLPTLGQTTDYISPGSIILPRTQPTAFLGDVQQQSSENNLSLDPFSETIYDWEQFIREPAPMFSDLNSPKHVNQGLHGTSTVTSNLQGDPDNENSLDSSGNSTSGRASQWDWPSLDDSYPVLHSITINGSSSAIITTYVHHYFDAQFYFNRYLQQPSPSLWILPSLLESPAVFNLTCAVSLFVQNKDKIEHKVLEWKRYRGEGIKAVEDGGAHNMPPGVVVGQQSSCRSIVEKLECAAHLLLLSSNQGLLEEVRTVLRSANEVLGHASFGTALVQGTAPTSEHYEKCSCKTYADGFRAALAQVSCAIFWYDSFLAIVTGQHPILDSQYLRLLCEKLDQPPHTTQLEIIGALRETASFALWKAEETVTNTFTLFKRAGDIHSMVSDMCMRTKLFVERTRSNENNESTASTAHKPGDWAVEEMASIQHAYSHALLIVLHAVVSNSSAPEIQDSVQHIASTIRTTSQRGSDVCRRCAWPIYTAARFAGLENSHLFTEIRTMAIDADLHGTVALLDIAKEERASNNVQIHPQEAMETVFKNLFYI